MQREIGTKYRVTRKVAEKAEKITPPFFQKNVRLILGLPRLFVLERFSEGLWMLHTPKYTLLL